MSADKYKALKMKQTDCQKMTLFMRHNFQLRYVTQSQCQRATKNGEHAKTSWIFIKPVQRTVFRSQELISWRMQLQDIKLLALWMYIWDMIKSPYMDQMRNTPSVTDQELYCYKVMTFRLKKCWGHLSKVGEQNICELIMKNDGSIYRWNAR